VDEVSAARESKLRSIFKAVTYRIAGTVTTVAVTFAVTGEGAIALAVGGIEPVVKVFVYYAHERAWQHIPIGTIRDLSARLAAPRRRPSESPPAP